MGSILYGGGTISAYRHLPRMSELGMRRRVVVQFSSYVGSPTVWWAKHYNAWFKEEYDYFVDEEGNFYKPWDKEHDPDDYTPTVPPWDSIRDTSLHKVREWVDAKIAEFYFDEEKWQVDREWFEEEWRYYHEGD